MIVRSLIEKISGYLQVKLIFKSEKLRFAFSTKDPYQSEHLSKVVYKFVCASCDASYVSQTCRHLTTRIDEHFRKDKKSHISTSYVIRRFVLDTTNTQHQLRIKESLHITWLKPILNKQKQYQYITSLSF